jgi:hypothetical protein
LIVPLLVDATGTVPAYWPFHCRPVLRQSTTNHYSQNRRLQNPASFGRINN